MRVERGGGNLTEGETAANEQIKDFLKSLFRSIERIYSFEILEEIFQDLVFEREAERLMEEEGRRGIEEENDF